jgi:hypothetical protein
VKRPRKPECGPGDLLVLFTNGITETMNPSDEEWGEDRLLQTLETCAGFGPGEIISRVMTAADAFASGTRQHDDMTLVVLKVCGWRRMEPDSHHPLAPSSKRGGELVAWLPSTALPRKYPVCQGGVGVVVIKS